MLTRLGWGIAVSSAALYAAGAFLGYPEAAVLAAGGVLAVVTAPGLDPARPPSHAYGGRSRR